MTTRHSHVLVFGNEKGGTGKSTLAMHVIVCLLERGYTIGVIDLDARQRTLSRYLENRSRYCEGRGVELPVPKAVSLDQSTLNDMEARQKLETSMLRGFLNHFDGTVDIIAIDSPGSYTYLSSLAHALADTLLTPMNDSFLDLDLIGHVDAESLEVESLSHYAEVVTQSRQHRLDSGKSDLDWIVARNRLGTLASRNNERVHDALMALQQHISFRYVPGLYERVIYRELFPKGLTMLDLDKVPDMGKLQLSHVAARNEVRSIVDSLNLPPAGGDLGDLRSGRQQTGSDARAG